MSTIKIKTAQTHITNVFPKVEALKAASAAVSTSNGSDSGSSRNAWSARPPSGLSEGRSKSLKSLIKRTPSARSKQVVVGCSCVEGLIIENILNIRILPYIVQAA